MKRNEGMAGRGWRAAWCWTGVFAVLALLALPACVAGASVDLTPVTEWIEGDEQGGLVEVTTFRHGESKITMMPGKDVQLLGGGPSRVVLKPADVPVSNIEIRAVGSGFPVTGKGLQAAAAGTLHGEALMEGGAGEPQQWKTFSGSVTWFVDLAYRLHEKAFERRVLFWTFEDVQFQFIVTSPPGRLAEAFSALRSCLFTWSWDDASGLAPVSIRMDSGEEEASTEE